MSSIRIHLGARAGCLPHSAFERPLFSSNSQHSNTSSSSARFVQIVSTTRTSHRTYITQSRSGGSELWAKESSSTVRHALNTNSRIRATAKKRRPFGVLPTRDVSAAKCSRRMLLPRRRFFAPSIFDVPLFDGLAMSCAIGTSFPESRWRVQCSKSGLFPTR